MVICYGLDGAGDYPWNVDKVHTNTQYLLDELGRGRLIRDSETQWCTKWSQGNIKLNPPRVKPEADSYTPINDFTTAFVTILQVNLHPTYFSNRQHFKFSNLKTHVITAF